MAGSVCIAKSVQALLQCPNIFAALSNTEDIALRLGWQNYVVPSGCSGG